MPHPVFDAVWVASLREALRGGINVALGEIVDEEHVAGEVVGISAAAQGDSTGRGIQAQIRSVVDCLIKMVAVQRCMSAVEQAHANAVIAERIADDTGPALVHYDRAWNGSTGVVLAKERVIAYDHVRAAVHVHALRTMSARTVVIVEHVVGDLPSGCRRQTNDVLREVVVMNIETLARGADRNGRARAYRAGSVAKVEPLYLDIRRAENEGSASARECHQRCAALAKLPLEMNALCDVCGVGVVAGQNLYKRIRNDSGGGHGHRNAAECSIAICCRDRPIVAIAGIGDNITFGKAQVAIVDDNIPIVINIDGAIQQQSRFKLLNSRECRRVVTLLRLILPFTHSPLLPVALGHDYAFLMLLMRLPLPSTSFNKWTQYMCDACCAS